MNPGQEMFYNFFMERTIIGKEEEAKALLNTGFEKQAAGTFDKAYLEEVMPKYFELIRPECIEDRPTCQQAGQNNHQIIQTAKA